MGRIIMYIQVSIIQGVMFGFEFVQQEKDNWLVVDLLIVRLMFSL